MPVVFTSQVVEASSSGEAKTIARAKLRRRGLRAIVPGVARRVGEGRWRVGYNVEPAR